MKTKTCADCPADISDRPTWTQRCKECSAKRRRAKQNAWYQEKYSNDPEYRERQNKSRKKKYSTDPEYREQVIKKNLDRYYEKKRAATV